MKQPTGRIEYQEDHTVSYSASGRNPPRPWRVIVDGVGQVNADETYAWAALHLADELAWRDPRWLRQAEKLKALKKELYRQHLEALTAERPDQDSTDLDLGRIAVYEGAPLSCHVCFTHDDHATLEEAHRHGCNR